MNAVDVSGRRFGRLLAIEPDQQRSADRHVRWRCVCDCGKEVVVGGNFLRRGTSKSCGCLIVEGLNARTLTHGMTRVGRKHKLYIMWVGMRGRCYNPNADSYKSYGARGIKVCDEWRTSFIMFHEYINANLGPCPPGMSLDRIDNDGDYRPGNVRWATAKEQRANQRNDVGFNKLTSEERSALAKRAAQARWGT